MNDGIFWIFWVLIWFYIASQVGYVVLLFRVKIKTLPRIGSKSPHKYKSSTKSTETKSFVVILVTGINKEKWNRIANSTKDMPI